MRVILLISVFVCMAYFAQSQLAEGLKLKSSLQNDSTKATIKFRCLPSTSAKPLLIVDGIITDLDTVQFLNADDLKSIDVVKGEAAIALWGSRGLHGVIFITTKKGKLRKFEIREHTGAIATISNAKISFISSVNNNDTLQLQTNSAGYAETDQLKSLELYKIVISKTGYKTSTGYYSNCINNDPEKIFLDKETTGNSSIISLYPNPVQRGTNINLRLPSRKEKSVQIIITNQSGHLLTSQYTNLHSGDNTIQIATRNNWLPGLYFVRFIDGDNVIQKEKLIIQ